VGAERELSQKDHRATTATINNDKFSSGPSRCSSVPGCEAPRAGPSNSARCPSIAGCIRRRTPVHLQRYRSRAEKPQAALVDGLGSVSCSWCRRLDSVEYPDPSAKSLVPPLFDFVGDPGCRADPPEHYARVVQVLVVNQSGLKARVGASGVDQLSVRAHQVHARHAGRDRSAEREVVCRGEAPASL